MKNWELKKLIDEKGYNQKKLAADAEVSEAYISNVVERKKDPSLKVLRSMAESLDVPVSKLLELVG